MITLTYKQLLTLTLATCFLTFVDMEAVPSDQFKNAPEWIDPSGKDIKAGEQNGALIELQIKEKDVVNQNAKSDKAIIDILNSTPDLSTLANALTLAQITPLLSEKGSFTIFAPSNEAFSKMPKGKLDELMRPGNQAKLADLLKYHIVSDKIQAKEMKTMTIKTLNGKELKITLVGSDVKVNNAKVIQTDLVGKNGVIHVIDAVLLPSEK